MATFLTHLWREWYWPIWALITTLCIICILWSELP